MIQQRVPKRTSVPSPGPLFRFGATSLALGWALLVTSPSASSEAVPAAPEVTGADHGTWTNLLSPGARQSHSAIYDPVRDRLLVFGGYDGGARGDVWGLTLSATQGWTQLEPSGTPGNRSGHSAIYDPLRDRMVVFGGATEGSQSQVWTLALSGTPAWSQLATSGTPPSARSGHTAFYDPVRDRMVVFGGFGFSVMNDVWVLTLSGTPAWSQLAPTGTPPTARSGHTAIYDPPRDRMLVFGGSDGGRPTEVWALNLSGVPAWTPLAPTGTPPGRSGHTAVYDPVGDRMLVFAGFDGSFRNDVWALSLAGTPGWSQLGIATPPSPRADHAAIHDPVRHRLLVFGGTHGEGYENDAWALALAGTPAWSPLVPFSAPPPERTSHVAILDPTRDRMLMFGGGNDAVAFGDLWELPLSGAPGWTQLTPSGTPPSARSEHAAIYDPVRDRMVVFGGQSFGFLNDVWALTLSGTPGWTQLAPTGTPPSGRMGHAAVYDPVRDRMLVFGGVSGAGLFGDVWSLTLSEPPAWSPLTPLGTPPVARWRHSLIYDPVGDRLIVFGGIEASDATRHDVWALTLSGSPTWSELTPAGTPPSERHGHTAIYDSARDRMMVFGGQRWPEWASFGGELGDVWVLALSGTPAWLELVPTGVVPGARWGHTALHDAARDRMVVFAGHEQRHRYFNDARALSFEQVVGVPPPQPPQGISLGQSRPNPARGDVAIPFVLPRPAQVSLRVYDTAGRAVCTVLDGFLPAGSHAPRWDGRTSRGGRATPGVYLYELRTEGHRVARRLMLLQ